MKQVFIDVREPYEFQTGHVKDAINIPLHEISEKPELLNQIPQNATLVVYCVSGNRASFAVEILKDLGYKNVTNGINKNTIEENALE